MRRTTLWVISVIVCLFAFIGIKAEILEFDMVNNERLSETVVEGQKNMYETKLDKKEPANLPVSKNVDNYAKPAIGFSVKTNTMAYYQTSAYNFDLADITKCEKYFDAADETLFPTEGIWLGNSYYVEASRKIMMGMVTAPIGLHKFDPETGVGELLGEAPIYDVDPLVNSLTYDYSTKTAYAIVGSNTLSTINLQNGIITPIVSLEEGIKSIACTYNGKIYGITKSHQLVRINKETGRLRTIGDTGIYISLDIPYCSMEFDRENDTDLYISYANERGVSNIATLDIKTGKATILGSLPDNNLVTALSIPFGFEAEVPAQVTDLSAKAGDNGALSATLNWTNPSKTYGGTQLSSISKIEIYQNGSLHATLQQGDKVTPGSKQTYGITVDNSALYEYEIVVYNQTGKSPVSVAKEIFIGNDRPGKVQDIQLSKSGKEVQITWKQPETGFYNGYFDTKTLTYNITRMPDNVEVAHGISGLTYTDKSITSTRNYSYQIQAYNSEGEGEIAMSEHIMVGDAFDIPYYANFDTEIGFSEWTVLDANEDGCTWYRLTQTDLKETRGEAIYVYGSGRDGGNDWLITPLLKLEKGEKYQLRFRLANNGINPYVLPIKLGKGLTSESQNISLASIEVAGNETESIKHIFEVSETGEYALSFYIEGAPEIAISHFSVEKILDTDAKLTYLVAPKKMSVGKPSTCTMTILNNGLLAFRNVKIQLEDIQGNMLSEPEEIVLSPSLATDETTDVSLEFIPKTEGLLEIRGHIILEGDENTLNDYSYPISIDIQPEGHQIVSITKIVALEQDPTNPSVFTETQMAHFCYGISCYYQKNNLHQCLYTRDNIQLDGGLITGLRYYYAFNRRDTKVDVEIYMSNTDENQLETWILPENQQLVYEGQVSLEKCPEGINTLDITLQNPLIYSGRNLCISIRSNVIGSANPQVLWLLNSDYSNLYLSRTLSENEDLTATAGTAYPYSDWVDLDINTNNVNLKGKITNSGGGTLEGIKVSLTEKSDLYTYTDANGEYKFYSLDAGNYTLQLSDWAYETVTAPVTIQLGQTTVLDKTMEPRAQHRITGQVMAPQGTPAEGAIIYLEGEKTLRDVTDGTGGISIEVPSGTYDLTVLDPSYRAYKQTLNIQNSGIELGKIQLEDIPTEVTNFQPAYNENGSVDITWNAPNKEQVFSYCSDQYYAALTSTFPETSTGKEAFMTVYPTPAMLNSVSWVVVKKDASSIDIIDFYIFDLDEAGRPTNKILYSAKDVKSTFNEWTVYTLPEWINAPNGFALAIKLKDNLSIGLDAGREYTRDVNIMCYNYDISYYNTDILNLGIYYNYLIRATGVLLEDYNDPIQKASEKPSLPSIANKGISPVALEQIDPNQIESLKLAVSQMSPKELAPSQLAKSNATYKVWRLLKGAELSPAKWTLLTPNAISETKVNDSDFANIAKGTYRYAIKAFYPFDVVSDNVLSDDYVVNGNKLSVSVKPSPECTGAMVRLNNFKTNYTAITNAEGKAEIRNILEGTYDLQVVLNGFETYAKTEIDMTQDRNIEVTLKDLLEKPQDLHLIKDKETKLVWAMKSTNILDDFEEDFVNPVSSHPWYMGEYPGTTGWTYLNADGKNLSQYLVNIGKYAFATVDLYATIPPTPTRNNVYPYSGDKIVMSHCVEELPGEENITDHYMFSPRLNFDKDFTISFMARAYVFNFIGEHIRIGYSTTDTNPASFTIVAEDDVQNMTWRGFEYEIPKEARYVMINHYGKGETTLLLDDIFIGIDDDEYNDLANTPMRSVSYEVYKDEVKLGTTTEQEYPVKLVEGESCTLGVKAIYSTGTSEMATLEYSTSIDDTYSSSLSVYPNPVKDWLTIYSDHGISKVMLSDLSGMIVSQEAFENVNKARLNVAHLPDGLYILTVINGEQALTCKITIKK